MELQKIQKRPTKKLGNWTQKAGMFQSGNEMAEKGGMTVYRTGKAVDVVNVQW